MVACNVCGGGKTELIRENYPGVIQGEVFKIYNCRECDAHFCYPPVNDPKMYDLMYSDKDTKGAYGTLFDKANKIKASKNPGEFLLKDIHSYYPVFHYLRDKKNLRILEVGCGYGYLTYALNKMGHHAFGMDLSGIAIDFATENFGRNYFRGTLDQFAEKHRDRKFDLVVGLEVIEHVPDAEKFVQKCLALLTSGGHMIFTTPNKDYSPAGSAWKTDIPPIHVSWFSPKTFGHIAAKNDLDLEFVDFSKHISSNEEINELVNYYMNKNAETLPEPRFLSTGAPCPKGKTGGFALKKFIKAILVETKPVRYAFNLFFKKIIYKDINYFFTLGVILGKR